MLTSTMYSAFVEVDRKGLATDDETDRAMDQLAPYHVALGGSPRGYASAQISLPAESLAQACATAAVVVSSALGAPAIACEVMTEAEFLAREGWAPLPELVSVAQAAERLGVTRQAVLQRINSGSLQAVKVGRDYAIATSALEAATPPAG